MNSKDTKDLIKWVLIVGGTLFGGDHLKDFATSHADEIKEFTTVLFAPILNNQRDIIFLMHVDQFQAEGHSLDISVEMANEYLNPPEDEDDDW